MFRRQPIIKPKKNLNGSVETYLASYQNFKPRWRCSLLLLLAVGVLVGLLSSLSCGFCQSCWPVGSADRCCRCLPFAAGLLLLGSSPERCQQWRKEGGKEGKREEKEEARRDGGAGAAGWRCRLLLAGLVSRCSPEKRRE